MMIQIKIPASQSGNLVVPSEVTYYVKVRGAFSSTQHRELFLEPPSPATHPVEDAVPDNGTHQEWVLLDDGSLIITWTQDGEWFEYKTLAFPKAVDNVGLDWLFSQG